METLLRQRHYRPGQPPATTALQVELVGDLACPFCFLGLEHLRTALTQLSALDAPQLRWQPFQLNPGLPRDGTDFDVYLAQRFGGRDAIAPALKQITVMGAESGIEFAFERIRRVPNTLDAHRLILMAQESGLHERLLETLFRGLFEQGLDIGSREVLIGLASACGMNAASVAEYLSSDRGTVAVQAIDANYRQQGITAVPHFVFNGRVAVAGVQDADTLITALDYALFQPLPTTRDPAALN